jgi:uncharacterized protein YjbI with pentapeptide repeats
MAAHDRHAARPPDPPDLPGELAALDGEAARDPARWSGAVVGDAESGGFEARGLDIEGARLERVDLNLARVPQLRLADVVLQGCNLANVHARGASLKRVELRGCRLTGAFFAESHLADVLVKDCRVDLAAFTAGKLERVTFEDCLMTQSDFQETGCESVRFLHCDLTEADITGARFRRSELRRCELAGLRGIESLRGVGVDWHDLIALAPALADAIGIRLLDADER